jgi:hypothetical protein
MVMSTKVRSGGGKASRQYKLRFGNANPTIRGIERRSGRRTEGIVQGPQSGTNSHIPNTPSNKTNQHDLQVTWSSPTDPSNPSNRSIRKKRVATFVVSCFTFISPVASSMMAPALSKMSSDLGITSEIETQLALSIFVLAYVLLGPLSEVFGRVYVLQLSNAWYFAWNLGCGFARNKEEMIVFRFFSGIGGSAPLAIGWAF